MSQNMWNCFVGILLYFFRKKVILKLNVKLSIRRFLSLIKRKKALQINLRELNIPQKVICILLL